MRAILGSTALALIIAITAIPAEAKGSRIQLPSA